MDSEAVTVAGEAPVSGDTPARPAVGSGKAGAMSSDTPTLRAEKRAVREKMRAMGLGYGQIAAEFARRYRLRPRTAWREAYGWSLKEAAAQINDHTGKTGLDPGGISAMTGSHLCEHEAWPGPAPKEAGRKPAGRKPTPYLLALLAAVYGCTVVELIDFADREYLPAADLLVLDQYSQHQPTPAPVAHAEQLPRPRPSALPAAINEQTQAETQAAVLELRRGGGVDVTCGADAAALSPLPTVAYLWKKPDTGGFWIEREVLVAAHDGSDHAELAEQRDIGEATLAQFRADVVRLSVESDTRDPFPLFMEIRRVRDRMHAVLDRRLWPRDQAELYLMLSCLNGVMGVTADRLGFTSAGEELIRAGWAYATSIDHHPLLAQLRQQLAAMAYRSGRYRQSRDLAASGLRYLSVGPNGANLHLKYAVAAAKIGETGTARRAVTAAHDAREREYDDELLEIGGEFAISLATHHYFAGAALGEIDSAEHETAEELERAANLYEAGPGPGEQHWFGGKALANIDLAVIRLRSGALDAAVAALAQVLSLPPAQRITSVTGRLVRVRAELARPRYQGSAQARDTDERIEDFGRETIGAALHDLPAGPA